MAHVRRQIREAIAAAVTGLATTGSRVFQSRVHPLRDADLPGLIVSTGDEDLSAATISNILQRDLDVHVRGVAKANADLDDTLDQIALEVETAVAAGYPNAVLRKIETDLDDTLEKPVGVIELTYRMTVFTAAGAPGTLI